MKDSGLKWVGQIPAEWEVSRLQRFVSQVKNRNTGNQETNLLSLSYGRIKRKSMETVSGLVPESYAGYNIVEADDIVLRLTDLQNDKHSIRVGRSTERGIVTSAYVTIRPTEDCHSPFLAYAILGFDIAKGFYGIGSGVRQGLTFDEVKKLLFFLPPLPEQRAIAARLDELTGRIESESKKIAAEIGRLEQYKKSFITEAVCGRVAVVGAGGVNETTGTTATTATETNATSGAPAQSRPVPEVAEVSGVPCRGCCVDRPPRPMKDSGIPWVGQIPEEWGVSPLKHYIDILAGYAFPSHDFDEKGIRLLRGVNVGVGSLRWEETVCWSQPVDDELREFLLREGDLIVGLDRPWIGGGTRVALVRKEDLPALLLQRVCRIRARKAIDLRLVYYWLASRAFQNSLEGSTTGVSVPHISPFQVGNFKIAIPPLPEQQAIAAAIDAKCSAVDAIVAKRKRQLDRLDALKRSLVYEYVTGKKEVA